MNKYVVLTVNGITPTSEGLFPRHDDGELFPSVYDIRIIDNPDKEIVNQLYNLIAGLRKGVVGSWEVYNYDPDDPNAGWMIDVYNRQYQPLYQIKCVVANEW